jgi:hypothetical protein
VTIFNNRNNDHPCLLLSRILHGSFFAMDEAAAQSHLCIEIIERLRGMTGGGNATVSSSRFRPSASIPVLSIARESELWGFLGFAFFGVIGLSVFYGHIVRFATPLLCLLWGLPGFISLFMPFFAFACLVMMEIRCTDPPLALV